MTLNGRLLSARRLLPGIANSSLCFSRSYKFLPASHHLDTEWNERLNAALMQQIRIEEFYVELRKKFDGVRSGSSLDVEIFVNKVERMDNLRQAQDILASFRSSQSTTIFRPAIYHAVIRSFIALDAEEELLPILADKFKYGLFLDSYSGNLLIDKFLLQGNLTGAVKAAFDFMWQEDFHNPLTRDLSLVSCLMFLENPQWEAITPPTPPEPVDTGEEVIKYVSFLLNPWFDDHFDIKNPKQLVGKTLFSAGKERNDLVGRSAQLVGLTLYEKWSKGTILLEKLAQSAGNQNILKSSVDGFLEALRNVPKPPEVPAPVNPDDIPPYPRSPLEEPETVDASLFVERAEKAVQMLQSKGSLEDGSLLDLAKNELNRTALEHGPADAAKQKEIYQKWTVDRDEEVGLQIQKFDLEQRLEELKRRRDQLKEEEDFLFFFERKNQWERLLTPRAREAMLEQQVKDGSYYDYRVQDAGYDIPQITPPETYKRTTRWKRSQETFDANQEYLRNK